MNSAFYSDLGEAELYRRMDMLQAVCPFLRQTVIGKSCAGRPIRALTVGHGQPVLWTGAFHGSERITGYLLLRCLEDLLTALAEGESLGNIRPAVVLNSCRLTVVPFVNPDGCAVQRDGYAAAGAFSDTVRALCGDDTAHYNANARGVDINHNFPAGWQALHRAERSAGITGPAKGRYGGPCPASEPETIALIELCRLFAFRHVLAFHSQGEVIYYPTGPHAPQKSREMADLLASACGYQPAEPEGLAVGGGFKDYFCETYRRPGFTVEVGLGENPLPFSCLPDLYERVRPMLLVSLML